MPSTPATSTTSSSTTIPSIPFPDHHYFLVKDFVVVYFLLLLD
jgi:hypothetical protein